MTDNTTNLREDIAYMRDLAEAGASTPLLGGLILVVVGAIFAVASAAHWLWFSLGDPETWMIISMWLGAAALCWIVNYAWPIRLMLKKPGISSPSNRASAWSWQATGFVVNVILGCCLIIAWRIDSSLPFTLFPSVILSVYGGAWYVSMKMSGQKWMWWPTLGSFAFSLILALAITSSFLFLIFALAWALLVLAPGIVMVRREPSLVV